LVHFYVWEWTFPLFEGLMRLKVFCYFPICLTILTVSIILSGCAAAFQEDDPWFGPDKVYHFVCAGAIGAGTTVAAKSNGMSRHDSPVLGISAAVTIGAGKEFYDLKVKETYWSWKDFIWDILGGAAGSYAMQ
jgi:putative lipoprotein